MLTTENALPEFLLALGGQDPCVFAVESALGSQRPVLAGNGRRALCTRVLAWASRCNLSNRLRYVPGALPALGRSPAVHQKNKIA